MRLKFDDAVRRRERQDLSNFPAWWEFIGRESRQRLQAV